MVLISGRLNSGHCFHLFSVDLPKFEFFVLTCAQNELLAARNELNLLDIVSVGCLASKYAAVALEDVEVLPTGLIRTTDKASLARRKVEAVYLVLVVVVVSSQRKFLFQLHELNPSKFVSHKHHLSVFTQLYRRHYFGEFRDPLPRLHLVELEISCILSSFLLPQFPNIHPRACSCGKQPSVWRDLGMGEWVLRLAKGHCLGHEALFVAGENCVELLPVLCVLGVFEVLASELFDPEFGVFHL